MCVVFDLRTLLARSRDVTTAGDYDIVSAISCIAIVSSFHGMANVSGPASTCLQLGSHMGLCLPIRTSAIWEAILPRARGSVPTSM